MLPTRRQFIAAGLGAAAMAPYYLTANAGAFDAPKMKNDRYRIGAIGMRYQGSVIAKLALPYADIVAIADVDRKVGEKAVADFGGKADLYEDYRKLLNRDDIDAVTIGAPDHWHVKMAIDACRAGKDVYVEKPLTLTVDEGKKLVDVVQETGRVLQTGNWQRSDCRFRLGVELVRSGAIGALRKVTVTLGKNKQGGPFQHEKPPEEFNWEMWQGQTPSVPYIKERGHFTFRWWYEYSGGQMTDWGCHHMDIAQWGIGADRSGPVDIQTESDFPDFPEKNGYNVAKNFKCRLRYENGVELEVLDTGRNGVMFEGDDGRLFVNRGAVSGKPIEDLAASMKKDVKEIAFDPEIRERFSKLYEFDNFNRPARAGKHDAILNHMGNFFDCVKTRRQPISDVVSQHRTASVCHLCNISMRLGRDLRWDPQKETFPDDREANAMLARPQRKGYEIG